MPKFKIGQCLVSPIDSSVYYKITSMSSETYFIDRYDVATNDKLATGCYGSIDHVDEYLHQYIPTNQSHIRRP